jgi:hypothetical protein
MKTADSKESKDKQTGIAQGSTGARFEQWQHRIPIFNS